MWIRDLDTKKIRAKVFEELRNVELKEKGEDNKQVLESIGEKRTVLNNVLRRTENWIGDSKKKLPFL